MLSALFIAFALLVCLFKPIYAQYTPTVLAGTGAPGWSGDNGPATSAKLGSIYACFVDSSSNTFFVDYLMSIVRKVDSAGIITTIGGTGASGNANAGGAFTSVLLNKPSGIVGDSNYLYISDSYHIWKYNKATGIVAIMAGTGTQGTAGDGGPASSAQINKAAGLWLTTDGTLYIAETGNNLVRKITTSNLISTVVGGGGSGLAGDGGPAVSTNVQLNAPQGVYMDTNGVLFVADRSNGRIRYVVNGIVNTYAGGGPSGNTADGFVATNAVLSNPNDVKGDSLGNIYVVEDPGKVRVVNYNTQTVTVYLGSQVAGAKGIWFGFGTTNKVCVAMTASVKTAPLYVNHCYPFYNSDCRPYIHPHHPSHTCSVPLPHQCSFGHAIQPPYLQSFLGPFHRSHERPNCSHLHADCCSFLLSHRCQPRCSKGRCYNQSPVCGRN